MKMIMTKLKNCNVLHLTMKKDNSGLLVVAAWSCWSTSFDHDYDSDDCNDDYKKDEAGDEKNGHKLSVRILLDSSARSTFQQLIMILELAKKSTKTAKK